MIRVALFFLSRLFFSFIPLLIINSQVMATASPKRVTSPVTATNPFRTLKTTEGINAVAFSPDGKLLASANFDGAIQFWRNSDGSPLYTLRSPTSESDPYKKSADTIAFSADGAMVASGYADGSVRVWQVATGQLLKTINVNSEQIHSVSFSPDSKSLAVSGETLSLWSISDEKKSLKTWNIENVGASAFSPDGEILAVSQISHIKLLPLNEGSETRTLSSGDNFLRPSVIVFASDGNSLIASGGRRTMIFRIKDGKLLYNNKEDQGHTVFSPDGKRAIMVSSDSPADRQSEKIFNTVRVLNVSDGQVLKTQNILNYEYPLGALAISPDGETLAVGGPSDNTILLWRCQDLNLCKAPKTASGF